MNTSEQHKATYLVNLLHFSDRFRLKTQISLIRERLTRQIKELALYLFRTYCSYYGESHVPVRVLKAKNTHKT